MRLVIDGRRLTAERTGVGRYLECLLTGWSVSGLPLPSALLVLHDRAGLDRVPPCEGLRTQVVGEGWPGLAWERFGLGRLLRPGDLLFAPTNLVPGGWNGPTMLVLFDTLLEVRPEDFPRRIHWRFRRRYRRAARRADRVIVPSRATADDARRFLGVEPNRLRVVPPAVDPAFRPREPDAQEIRSARSALGLGDAPYFLFVGKRSRRRHVPAILSALARHRRDFPDHRLVLAGPSSEPIDTPGVIEAGHVSEPILRGLLAGATALLYPSESEGFGLPVVEALASGCPVITLRRGALLESGGDAALFLDEADPDSLAEAMRTFASDSPLRAWHVARGLEHASRFGLPAFVEAVSAEIRDLGSMIANRRDGHGIALR